MSDAPTETPPAPDLLGSALQLVTAEGWPAYAPARLARTTGIGLAEACLQLPDQGAILAALGRRVDLAMLDVAADELLEMTPKERAFELLMRRFEALEPARPALARLRRDGPSPLWPCALGNVARAVKRAVEAAGLTPAGSLRGVVVGAALAAVYVATARVWLDDDSPDRAVTMAELDRRLDAAGWVFDRVAG